MSELHLPWLELTVLVPLMGAAGLAFVPDRDRARKAGLWLSGLTLLCALGAWQDFLMLRTFAAHDNWDLTQAALHFPVLSIDALSSPLLPMGALLFFLTILATVSTKVQRFSFSRTLASEAILLATFACRSSWGVIGLLAAAAIPMCLELRQRGASIRVFLLHTATSIVLMVCGQVLLQSAAGGVATTALVLLSAGALIRNGVVPAHCWISDLFQHASFGTALLYVTPMVGAYAIMRLVLPSAPEWLLYWISVFSLITSLYAAGMALVQLEARRFSVYLFLSFSSLVLVGLESGNAVGLTGALCVWLSTGLALGGFGLTLRAIEARTGRLSLAEYHGYFKRAPGLAGFFLLTGLASIGFPATIGFVGTELIVEGAVHVSAVAAALVVMVAALNGLAVLLAYFRVFGGVRTAWSISVGARWSERVAVLVLTALILGGGLFPHPGVTSRYRAARALLAFREQQLPSHRPSHAGPTHTRPAAPHNPDTRISAR